MRNLFKKVIYSYFFFFAIKKILILKFYSSIASYLWADVHRPYGIFKRLKPVAFNRLKRYESVERLMYVFTCNRQGHNISYGIVLARFYHLFLIPSYSV